MRLSEKTNSGVLNNLQEKLESGFYLDKINIDGREIEVYEKNEKELVLLFKNGKIDDGGDSLAVRLPLPFRFDEEWFNKYKDVNISCGSIIACYLEGLLK